MFDLGKGEAPAVDDVHGAVVALSRIGGAADDGERIDLLRALEELKCAAEGAQAVLAAALDRSVHETEAAAGVPAERRGRGVAAQVALARRESPYRARQHVGLALVLRDQMPFTRRALRLGHLSEWRAMLLVRETACLSAEHRAEVDRRLAEDVDAVEAMGDRELIAAARELAYQLDPESFVARRARAEADRRVTARPMPDVMSQVSALLPVRDGVAVWAVLSREADRLRAVGDERSRDQIMADTLVTRVLSPGIEAGSDRPTLMINITVSDAVLLGDKHGMGWVKDYGAVPGDLLREWIADNAEAGVEQWVRRLYVTPGTGELVAMDSAARRFEGKLADYLRLRDRTCRTPYCDAPIRHLDHLERHADGGPTSAENGQGACEACNYAKEALGWSARPRPGPGGHTVEITTPTGHRYTSAAPRLSAGERGFQIWLDSYVLTA